MDNKLFETLLGSVKEAGAIKRGESRPAREFIIDVPEVAAIRRRSKASQSEFAAMLGISLNTLQNWEQGRNKPVGPARVLLNVMDRHPEAVIETARALRPHQIVKPSRPLGRKPRPAAKPAGL